jgi:hypothetical protein
MIGAASGRPTGRLFHAGPGRCFFTDQGSDAGRTPDVVLRVNPKKQRARYNQGPQLLWTLAALISLAREAL